MVQFKVPDSPTVYTKTLGNFLGVDFTSITPDIRRGTNLINLINNNGYLETRPGYNVIGKEFGTASTLTTSFGDGYSKLTFTSIRKSAKSNDLSITFIKPTKRNSKLKFEYINKQLIYTLVTDDNGNILTTGNDIKALDNYYVTITVENGDLPVKEMNKTNLSGGASQRINGIWNVDRDTDEIFVVHVGTKLYTLDNTFSNPTEITTVTNLNDTITQMSSVYLRNQLIIFDGKRAIIYGKSGTSWGAQYLDSSSAVYIPIVAISRKPNGMGSKSYQAPNFLSNWRINTFVADGTSTTYVLESLSGANETYGNTTPIVKVLDNNTLEWKVVTVKSYDKTKGTVILASAPPKFVVDGRDSVSIQYEVITKDSSTGKEVKEYINGCTIATLYGYGSNNTRIFVSGNSDYPNVDYYSYINEPTYFPADAYRMIGYQPIVNYAKLNDGTLAVQKAVSDSDYTIYYTDSVIYNQEEGFTIKSGVKSVGCIGKYANANLMNEPLTLTETGVFAILGSSYGEKFANERSYFVKEKLLKEPNLENAIAISYQGKYYLAINNHVYVADARYRSKVDASNAYGYQYEWYYWENVPVRVWFTYNNDLYFATEDGDICKFNDTVLDYNIPMTQLYDTAFLDLDSITQSKTVKRVTVITRPYEDSEYTLSYVTIDDIQDIITKETPQGNFPATLQEKEKIKKIMYVKFRLYNNTPKKMNFFRIGIEYIFSGRYRGE